MKRRYAVCVKKPCETHPFNDGIGDIDFWGHITPDDQFIDVSGCCGVDMYSPKEAFEELGDVRLQMDLFR